MSESITRERATAVVEAPADRPEIVMSRVFDAPRHAVFRAWTDSDVLDQWWGPDGFRNSTHAFDFCKGGAWDYTMHGPDGTDYPNHITYLEIDPPERIVYDHGETAGGPVSFQVAVSFMEQGDKTRLEMRMVFPNVAARDEAVKFGAEGGRQTLARLAGHLAAEETRFTIEPGKPEVVISRDFDAPRDIVFAAYTDPKAIPEWWGPRQYKTVVEEMEPWRGGRWRFWNVEEDGTRYAFRGVYHDVVAPERLVQTFEFEGAPGHVSLETATFEDLGDKTRVTAQAVFQSVEARDAMVASGMERGARQTWQRLVEYVEKRQEKHQKTF